MDPILIAIICASLSGSGAVVLKCCLDKLRDPQEEVRSEHSLEQTIGNILEEAQRNSGDSDTEIKINIHTHHKERE